jgi:hypothetical protein
MRTTVIAVAAGLAMLATGEAGANRANAMTLPARAELTAAIAETSIAHEAAYVCRGLRHHRRCRWIGYSEWGGQRWWFPYPGWYGYGPAWGRSGWYGHGFYGGWL